MSSIELEYNEWFNIFKNYFFDDDYYYYNDYYYANNDSYYNYSLLNFQNNDILICQHNLQNFSFTLGHNQYSGWNTSQWYSFISKQLTFKNDDDYYNTLQQQSKNNNNNNNNSNNNLRNNIPSSLSWLSSMTPIKDQGKCGCCYAEVAVGLVESHYQLKYNKKFKPISMSIQQVLECDDNNYKCQGGSTYEALDYISNSSGGLIADAIYPYSYATYNYGTVNTSQCKKNQKPITNSGNFQVWDAIPKSDYSLINNLQSGPTGHYIVANCSTFHLYASGIYTDNCIGNVNHGVMVISYTPDYYTIRNSWGTTWGENGYMRMKRTINDKTAGLNQILWGPFTIYM